MHCGQQIEQLKPEDVFHEGSEDVGEEILVVQQIVRSLGIFSDDLLGGLGPITLFNTRSMMEQTKSWDCTGKTGC